VVQDWLLKHQQSWSGHDAEADRFLADSGLDPVRDIDALVVAVTHEPSEKQVLVLAAGRYDQISMGAAFVKRGATVAKVAGVDVYTFTKARDDKGSDGAVALYSPDLVIGGDPAAVTAALGSAPFKTNLAMTEIGARRIDPRAQFWAVALIPEQVRQAAKQVNVDISGDGAQLVHGLITAGGTVSRIDIQATLGKELELSGIALVDTAENAGLLRDTAKGAIAALRLQASDSKPQLVELLRSVEVKVDGTEVRGSVAVPVPMIQEWAKEASAHHLHHDESTAKPKQ
jgi:hypothetical protein